MITITINSIDRSQDIEQFSLRYSDTKTKAPKKISFAIKGEKTYPPIGQAVQLLKNGTPIFSGTIVSRTEEIMNSGVRRYLYECYDGFFGMDGKLVIKAYNDTTLGAIATDIVTNFTSGFTISVPLVTPAVKTVRFNYEQPSTCLRKLCEAVGWEWSVSATNVITISAPGSTAAPFVADEVSGHVIPKTLNFDRNILELKNIVYVRGGEYEQPILAADAVDKYEANGIDNTFPLVYRYGNTQVTVNGVAQTIGVDFIDDPLLFDCIYNFQEKLVRFPDGTLTSGQVVRVFGNAKVPLIVQAEDGDSVLAYGAREHVEIDKSINSITEAETLAQARLDQWREGSREGSFESYEDGWAVGQTVRVTSTVFGVDEDYIVNRVSAVQHDNTTLKYTIEFIKSGQTELTDMLIALIGESKKNIVIADNEVLQRLFRINDAFGVTDEITTIIKTVGPYVFHRLDNANFSQQPTLVAPTNTIDRFIDGTAAGSLTNSLWKWGIGIAAGGNIAANFDTLDGFPCMKVVCTNMQNTSGASNHHVTQMPAYPAGGPLSVANFNFLPDVTAGVTYNLSGLIKVTAMAGTGVVNVVLGITWYDAARNRISTFQTSAVSGVADWTARLQAATAPAGAVKAAVSLQLVKSGAAGSDGSVTAYFRDIVMVQNTKTVARFDFSVFS